MEGSNHGYLQEEPPFEDLMNNAGWPGSTDQFGYQQQAHPAQDLYPRFPQQTQFDHYDLPQQQQAFNPASFSNSPYVSQYQHARPSDVFGPASYNIDPSLQPYQGSQGSYSFPQQQNNTISPQSLQYSNHSSQQQNHSVSSAMFQHTGNPYHQRPQEQQPLYNNIQNEDVLQQLQALPKSLPGNDTQQKVKRNFDIIIPAARPQTINAEPVPAVDPLRTTNHQLLATKNSSSRSRFEHAPYVAWEDTPIQVAPGLKNTIPKYHPRKSKSGKDIVPGFNVSRISTPARSSIKKIRAPKETKASLSKYKGTSKQASRVANLRDGASVGAGKSPTPTETSSSEEETSSEEESEYEEDAAMPVTDISTVRLPTRPSNVPKAAEWDAIGIVWKDPFSAPDNDIVKGAIEEYANVVTGYRTQLKQNAADALSRPADAAILTTQRNVLLDQLYETVNAAVKHGYPTIVENLGSHPKLLLSLTTTLMDCIKANDFVGPLPRVIFKLLARFQTLSEEMLKKLKFDGIQKKWIKKADEEIKKDIASILANTIESREKAAKAQKEAARAEEQRKLREKLEQAKARNAENMKAISSASKRPREGDNNIAQPNKKFASDVAGAPAPSPKTIASSKRPGNLLGITTKPPKAAQKKSEPPVPSGPSFSISGLLADINKPPEPPKAPEAPVHPQETPEEKARRKRKESRRHLRVKFKEGPELEQIRLFKHEQAEDEGRQDDMLRDAHDDRSEGMMLKQRVDVGLDDDEGPSGDIEDGPYPDLVKLNLNDLNKETLFGPTYTTRGGGKTFTTAEQQVQERREALELMVVYTSPDDIPPSPKEPLTEVESHRQEHELKGPAEPWIVQRLQQIQQYGPEYTSQILASQNQARKLQSLHETAPHSQAKVEDRGYLGPPIAQTAQQQRVPRLQQQQPPPFPDTPTPAMESEALQNIMAIVARLKGKPYPPVEPPEWMANEAQRAIWWEGYHRDKATKERQANEAQLAQMQAAQYQAPPMVPTPQSLAPQMSYPPQLPQTNSAVALKPHPFPYQVSQPAVSEADANAKQWEVYLASITNAQNGNGSTNQQYDMGSWTNGGGRVEGNTNDGQSSKRDGEWDSENKRSWSKQNQDSYDSKPKKKWKGGFGNEGPLDANGQYKGKKRPCTFWQQGKCAKGADCTFLHD